MAPASSARCIWEVTAGLIPGEPDPKRTLGWGLTSEEWHGAEGLKLYIERAAQAAAYASYLQLICSQGLEVNWIRVDFIWL